MIDDWMTDTILNKIIMHFELFYFLYRSVSHIGHLLSQLASLPYRTVLFNSNKLDTAPCGPCPQHPMKDSLTTWFADTTEWRASDGEWEVGDWKIIGYIHADPALLGMQLARWVKRKQTRVSLLEIQHARFSKYGPRRKPNLHPSCLLNIRGRWTGSQTTHGHAVSACLCAITGLSDWVAQSFRRVPLSNEAPVSVCDAGKAAAKQYRAFCQRRDRLSGPPL